MDNYTNQQIDGKFGEVDKRFESLETFLKDRPTRAELNAAINSSHDQIKQMISGLADKEDIARLNNVVHNFTLGVQIVSTGSKFLYYIIVSVATFVGAISLLSGSARIAGGWFLHHLGL